MLRSDYTLVKFQGKSDGPRFASSPYEFLRSRADHRSARGDEGVLKVQFGLAEKVLAESVFPDSGAVKPMQGLVG